MWIFIPPFALAILSVDCMIRGRKFCYRYFISLALISFIIHIILYLCLLDISTTGIFMLRCFMYIVLSLLLMGRYHLRKFIKGNNTEIIYFRFDNMRVHTPVSPYVYKTHTATLWFPVQPMASHFQRCLPKQFFHLIQMIDFFQWLFNHIRMVIFPFYIQGLHFTVIGWLLIFKPTFKIHSANIIQKLLGRIDGFKRQAKYLAEIFAPSPLGFLIDRTLIWTSL